MTPTGPAPTTTTSRSNASPCSPSRLVPTNTDRTCRILGRERLLSSPRSSGTCPRGSSAAAVRRGVGLLSQSRLDGGPITGSVVLVGGLVGVLGRASGVVARTAIEAMTRNAGVSPTLHNAACGVVGICSVAGALAHDAKTDVAVALHGELIIGDSVAAGTTGAERLLQLYLADAQRMSPPDGNFSAVILDPRVGTLTLITDLFASNPIFVALVGERVVASSELKGLIAAGLRPVTDYQGWAEILAYEHALGTHTPLDGVWLAPSAATVEIEADGTRRVTQRPRFHIDPLPDETDPRENRGGVRPSSRCGGLTSAQHR